jgi:hypothetical protein
MSKLPDMRKDLKDLVNRVAALEQKDASSRAA